MFKAMVWKEVRECGWIAAVGFLVNVVAVLMGRGFSFGFSHSYGPKPIPMVGDCQSAFALILGVTGLLIAVRQTLGEEWGGTLPVLLHRPVCRQWIWRAKLVIGASLVFLSGGVLLVGYGIWASIPGNVIGPFDWSMSAEPLSYILVCVLVYLGGFLGGISPGSWWQRVWPAVASAVLALFLSVLAIWWTIASLVLAALVFLWWSTIAWITQTRDFA